jgi:hypothetical protein
MMQAGVGFTCLFHLLLSGYNPVDFIDPIDPQKRNTFASGITLFYCTFCLDAKSTQKNQGQP